MRWRSSCGRWVSLFCSKKKIKVYYEGEEVGDYESDLTVNDLVIVETKAKESLREEHEAQLINYLKATKIEVDF